MTEEIPNSNSAAVGQPALPQLLWEGPDEDGDYIVRLSTERGLMAHGATYQEALHRLGSVLDVGYEDQCAECKTKPVGQPDLRALLEEIVSEAASRPRQSLWDGKSYIVSKSISMKLLDRLAAVLAVKDTRSQTEEDR